MYKKKRLKNGIRLITAKNDNIQTVTALAIFGVGSRDENGKDEGMAHFLEHMLFKGSEKRPDCMAINKELDSIGASYNAFTGKECTGFWIKCIRKDLPLAIDVLSDMILHPLFAPHDIETEKGPVLEEIKMYEDAPMRDISSVFESLLFDGHSLAHDQLGSAENVRNFSHSKLRSFYERHYHPDNLVLAISGNFDEKLAEEEVREAFGHFAKKKADHRRKRFSKSQKIPRVLLKYKKTDQTNFSLGFRALPTGHRDEYALDVLNVILGGNDSSRLYETVREKEGLAYYVYSYVGDYEDAGYLTIQTGVGNDKCKKAISIILDEIRKVKSDGIEEEELARAKRYIKGKMAIGLESSSSVADFIASQELSTGKILTPEEKFDKINAVTSKDLTSVARYIFKEEKMDLAIIGPFKNRSEFEKILKI